MNKNIAFPLIMIVATLFFLPIFPDKTFYAFDVLFSYWPYHIPNTDTAPYNLLISDPVNVFYPFQHAYHQSGNWLPDLWNAALFAGHVTAPPIHPLVLLLFHFLPTTIAHDVLLWACLCLIMSFTWLYLKHLGIDGRCAMIGAIAWAFNGYVMVWFEFEHVPLFAFALPMSLLAVERLLKESSVLNILFFTLGICFSISAGFGQYCIYQLLFIAIYILISILTKYSSNPPYYQRKLVVVIACGFVALSLCSSFFLSHLHMMRDANRTAFGYDELFFNTGRLFPEYLATLFFPDFFGSPVTGENAIYLPLRPDGGYPYNNYNELCIYVGILPLFFLLAALAGRKKTMHSHLFGLTALVTLCMPMGGWLYYPLARFVPGLAFSTPTRILYLFHFCMAILSAFGAQALLSQREKLKKYRVLVLFILIPIGFVILFGLMQTSAGKSFFWNRIDMASMPSTPVQLHAFYDITNAAMGQPLMLSLLAFCCCAALLLSRHEGVRGWVVYLSMVLLAYDLMSFGIRYNTTSPRQEAYPDLPSLRYLRQDQEKFRVMMIGDFFPNVLFPAGIEEVGGYLSLYPRTYGIYMHLAQGGSPDVMPSQFDRSMTLTEIDSPLLDLLNMKYILFPPHTRLTHPRFRKVYDAEITIYQNLEALDRAYWVSGAEVASSERKLRYILASSTRERLKNTVFLSPQADQPPPPSPMRRPESASAVASTVRIESHAPDEVHVSVSASEDGFLVLSENWDSGWRATVDDAATPIYRANITMRSIFVPAGRHHIVFRYAPPALKASLMLSVYGSCALLLLTLLAVPLTARYATPR